jgi:hypothetical protein
MTLGQCARQYRERSPCSEGLRLYSLRLSNSRHWLCYWLSHGDELRELYALAQPHWRSFLRPRRAQPPSLAGWLEKVGLGSGCLMSESIPREEVISCAVSRSYGMGMLNSGLTG